MPHLFCTNFRITAILLLYTEKNQYACITLKSFTQKRIKYVAEKKGYEEITGVEVFRYAALYTIASKLRHLLVDFPAITCRPISKIAQSKQNDQTRPRVWPGRGAAQRDTILHRFGPGHPSRSVVQQSVRPYRDRLHKNTN